MVSINKVVDQKKKFFGIFYIYSIIQRKGKRRFVDEIFGTGRSLGMPLECPRRR